MLAYAVAPTPMAADAYEAAHEKWAQLIAHLRSPEAHQMSHSDLEALLEVEGRELLRRLLQAHLDERSPGTVAEPVLGADGRAHTHQRTQTLRDTPGGAGHQQRVGHQRGWQGRADAPSGPASRNAPGRRSASLPPRPSAEARRARAQQTDGDGGGRLYHQAMGPYPRRHRARVAADACGRFGPPAPRSQARLGLARAASGRGD